jgi:hypothetical protein
MPASQTAVAEKTEYPAFPIRAYNMLQEQERVVIPEDRPGYDDPELRKRIQFSGGSYLVRDAKEYDALKTKMGVVFEDFPPEMADRPCPRCGRPFRNFDAYDKHVLGHMAD